MPAEQTPVRPPWFDPRMPARHDCVLKALLEDRARRFPDRRLALFEDGSEWSYSEGVERVRRRAAALQRLGVRKGDRVAAWLPNGPELVVTWFAINWLGAVFVPVNTAYRGDSLRHVLSTAAARLLLAHRELVPRLGGLAVAPLERVVAVGGDAVAPRDCKFLLLGPDALDADPAGLDDSAQPEPWDIQSIIYTSGTTGLSKGVLSPYLQLYTTATVVYGYLRDGECILVNLPLFHVGGTSAVTIAVVRAGSFYLVDGFSTDRFWDQVRRGNCTTTSGLIGVMGSFLMRAPPTPRDRDNPLRHITMFPVNEQTVELGERFGFDYTTGFNMTEVSAPLVSDVNSRVFGGCGRPRSGVECRLVDANDQPVPDGAVGELIVRSDLPWTMNAGYDGLPEETARAWRNGWFHTGDLFRRDSAGTYYFVDRLKDAIRRRGENISSMEVESAVRMWPAVDDCVAIGIPADSEEEVMVVVVPKKGMTIDPRAMIDFLVERLPYFAVPRFVRVVPEIPKTETNKHRKYLFREEGVTADTWDREAAGIRLRRERFDV